MAPAHPHKVLVCKEIKSILEKYHALSIQERSITYVRVLALIVKSFQSNTGEYSAESC